MNTVEVIPGVYQIRGKYVEDFGYLTSYLLIGGDELLIIDPGTAGDPGDEIVKAIEDLGFKPRNDVAGILCTHGHPDHVGGAGRLRKATGASIMIHKNDASLLEDPQSFINERLLLDFAQRFAMKLERGPLRVNYRGLEPDRIFKHQDKIKVGNISIDVIHTAGHSSGHCLFYERKKKVLFSGDEVNNYPNEPRKFYVDLSGSFTSRSGALDTISKLPIECLCPSHDISYLENEVGLQFKEARDAMLHFQDTVLHHLSARGDADIQQLVFDIQEARSIPIPTGIDALLPTTLFVCLSDLTNAGLVRELEDGVWEPV